MKFFRLTLAEERTLLKMNWIGPRLHMLFMLGSILKNALYEKKFRDKTRCKAGADLWFPTSSKLDRYLNMLLGSNLTIERFFIR